MLNASNASNVVWYVNIVRPRPGSDARNEYSRTTLPILPCGWGRRLKWVVGARLCTELAREGGLAMQIGEDCIVNEYVFIIFIS